ncbi:MAG: sigma-70 family RNA polymerase sigma factor [Candidatus Gastranaerophilales bacterium]|nr:sigma-70 family RNA polymerase sigma factor [Candidatus Gastranaerophilales bacterium]
MDKNAFTEKVLQAEQSLYRVAWSILQNDADCADAMQNAILSAYSSLDDLRNEDYFQTWLTRILINESNLLLRKRKNDIPFEEYMEAETGYEENTFSPVFCEIQKLEPKYRIPFVLHYVEGYSVREIAKMCRCTEGAVKTRLYRSRKLLRESLKGVKGYE